MNKLAIGMLVAVLLLVPSVSLAASAKTTCALTVNTSRGTEEIAKSAKVLLSKGDRITVTWESANADSATDAKGKRIALFGSETGTPSKDAVYEYRFKGAGKATCAAAAFVTDVSITNASLTTTKSKPVISGSATGVKAVSITIAKDAFGDPIYTSKDVRVKNGQWEVKVPKEFSDGTYQVNVYGPKDMLLNYIVTGTLTVTSGGTPSLSVSQDRTIADDTASPQEEVPVAYLKIRNGSKGLATFTGVYLQKTGSASDRAFIGLGIGDDIGGASGGRGGVEGYSPFKDGLSYVPTNATLKPGETRIYTITASLSKDAGAYAGKSFTISPTALVTAVKVTGLPFKGATYTLVH